MTEKEEIIEKVKIVGINNGFRLDHPEDWYQKIVIKSNKIRNVEHYFGSINNVVRAIFPDYNLYEWKFYKTIDYFWDDDNNIKVYLKWIESELNIQSPEGWYKVSKKIIETYKGKMVMKKLGGVLNFGKFLYPDYNYKEFKFTSTSNNYWKNSDNIFNYLKWLEQEMSWSEPSDWYKMSKHILKTNYGGGINDVKIYDLCKIIYPNFDFKPWKFEIKTRDWWQDSTNRLECISDYENNHNIKSPEDWYDIENSMLYDYFGAITFEQVKKELIIKYKDYTFLPWKFKTTFWDETTIYNYLKWLEQEMGWLSPEDWYQISADIFNNNYGHVPYSKGISNIVKIIYPDYEWDSNRLLKKSKTQTYVFNMLKKHFNNKYNIIIDDRKTIINPLTNNYLELDIYIPDLNLAIECDGIQHFEAIEFFGGETGFNNQQIRDYIKDKSCKNLNIRLIRIPYYIKTKEIKNYFLREYNKSGTVPLNTKDNVLESIFDR